MRIGLKWRLFATAVLFSSLLVWLIVSDKSESTSERGEKARSSEVVANTSSSEDYLFPEANVVRIEELVDRLLSDLDLLKSMHSELEAQRTIRSMFQWLEETSADKSAIAITRVLETRKDAFTFGRFGPGKNGFLKAYPTFRTALMDELEKLDPVRAVAVGKDILDTSENADEWAIALRTLSRHAETEADQVFLQSKVQDLLHKITWLEEPSFSYLHAFDAAVHDGQIQTIQRLGELVSSPPNRAVGHAAILSVDRFFQQSPTIGSTYLIDNPDFLETNAGFRASLMARVNPVNPIEMTAAENYLESNYYSDTEKRTFFQSFPNFNSTFSYNLVSESLVLSRAEMRQRSVAAFEELSRWLNDQRYPKFEDEISSAVSRLAKNWKLDQ